METLKLEFKKFFIINKGIFIVPLILIVILALNTATLSAENIGLEINKEEYNKITSTFNLTGKVNKESEKRLNSLIDDMEKANIEFEKVFYDFQIGKIDLSTYQEKSKALGEKINSDKTLKIIKSQFEYAKENTNNRYILYTNGWNLLFSNYSSIYFLIFALIIITLLFSSEIDNSLVKKLIITTKNGKNKLIISKIAVLIFTIIVSFIFYNLTYFSFVKIKFGLPSFGFPIQSLENFQNLTSSISLINAFLVTLSVRLLSLITFSLIAVSIFLIINSSIGGISISFILILLSSELKDDIFKYLPQNITSYNLFDFNVYLALIINLCFIVLFLYLNIILWKRKNSTKWKRKFLFHFQ